MELGRSDTVGPQPRHAVLWGTLFWTAFSMMAVLVRGIRWDENYEFAQVLLGIIPYPEGHPLAQYVHGFYSLQTWSLAGLMAVSPSPFLANGLRNMLFLLATVVPPFLMGSLLGRRARWGHVAALLVLLGIHIPFYSNYPVQVWPGLYSNGHIGLGCALLTLYLLLAGRHRRAYLLFGLMPAIHAGQFPPLLGLVLLRLLWNGCYRHTREWRIAWRWTSAGFVVCAFGFAARRTLAQSLHGTHQRHTHSCGRCYLHRPG